VAVKLVYAYALLLLFAFASALVALIFYVSGNYHAAAVSALTAATAYLATRIVLFLITRRE
jgi:hypothetical protein